MAQRFDEETLAKKVGIAKVISEQTHEIKPNLARFCDKFVLSQNIFEKIEM